MKTNQTKPVRTSMFRVQCWMLNVALLATAGSALADVHYVDVNGTNATPPYTNWSTAATNIQDAVDAAVAGDEVVVTNGTYQPIRVDKPLSVRSVNGAQITSIDGRSVSRCAYLANGASLCGFTLANGYAYGDGGGAYGGTLNNCILESNMARGNSPNSLGGNGGGAAYCTLNNCVLAGNSAYNQSSCSLGTTDGGDGGGAYYCTLFNCTLSGNSANNYLVGPICFDDYGQYGDGGGTAYCSLFNCILCGNSAQSSPVVNYRDGYYGDYGKGGAAYRCELFSCMLCCLRSGCDLTYDCGGSQSLFASSGTIFTSNSPCINAGNNSYATNATDLDGNPRIAGGTVDIGAYEFQAPVSQISYAWLQAFGLPINAATDSADPDGDGVDNYHEWLAHSDPTNPFSFPPLLTLIPDGPDIILTWPTNAFGFTLQSTTNLSSPSAWATNSPAPVVIGGQNVIINPVSGPQQFYRLVH